MKALARAKCNQRDIRKKVNYKYLYYNPPPKNCISHLLLAPTQSLIHGQRYIQANVVTLSCLYHVLLEHEFFTIDFLSSIDLLS